MSKQNPCVKALHFVPGLCVDHATWPLHPGTLGAANPETSVYDAVLPPLLPSNAPALENAFGMHEYVPLSASASSHVPSPYPGMDASVYTHIAGDKARLDAVYAGTPFKPTYSLPDGGVLGMRKGRSGPWTQPGFAPQFQAKSITDAQIAQAGAFEF